MARASIKATKLRSGRARFGCACSNRAAKASGGVQGSDGEVQEQHVPVVLQDAEKPSASRGRKQPKSPVCHAGSKMVPREDERKLAGGDPTRSSSEVADCQDKQEALQESQRSESKKIGRDLWRRNSHAAKNSEVGKAPTSAEQAMKESTAPQAGEPLGVTKCSPNGLCSPEE